MRCKRNLNYVALEDSFLNCILYVTSVGFSRTSYFQLYFSVKRIVKFKGNVKRPLLTYNFVLNIFSERSKFLYLSKQK